MSLPEDDNLTPDGTGYFDVGRGIPIVCLHGLGLDRAMWGPLVARLECRYRLIGVDLLGHGQSATPPANATLDHYVSQLSAVLDHLNIQSAALLGFDFGAQVAMAAAAADPVRHPGLVLVSAAYRRLKPQRDMLLRRVEQARRHGPSANADSAIQRWFSAKFQAEHQDLVQQIHNRVASNEPVGYVIASELYALADTFTDSLLKDIQCPALIISGALDMGTTPEMARRLAKAITDSTLLIVPRQKHMLPLEAPDKVAQAVTAFL